MNDSHPLRKTTHVVPLAALSLLLLSAGMCRQAEEPQAEQPPAPEAPLTAPEETAHTSEAMPAGPTPEEIEEQERRSAIEAAERELAEREARLAAEQETLRREQEIQAEQQRLAAERAAAAERERQLAAREQELQREEAELAKRQEALTEEQTAAAQPAAPEPLPEPAASYEGAFDEPWRESQEPVETSEAEIPVASEVEASPTEAVASDPGPFEPASPIIPTATATVRAGARLEVQTATLLSSATARIGDPISASLVQDIRDSDGKLLIPAGAEVLGRITEATPYHRGGGAASLGVEFTNIVISADQTVGIRASFVELGADQRKNRKKVIAGAVVGAILGHVLGGDGSKNVIVGAAAGAAAGGAMVARAKDRDAEIPAGQIITLQLEEVVTVEIEYGDVSPR